MSFIICSLCTSIDSLLPQYSHAIFNTVNAIRDLGEVAFANLLVFLVECAVVTADYLQSVAENINKVILPQCYLFKQRS